VTPVTDIPQSVEYHHKKIKHQETKMSDEIIVREDNTQVQSASSQPMRLIEMALANNADIDKLE